MFSAATSELGSPERNARLSTEIQHILSDNEGVLQAEDRQDLSGMLTQLLADRIGVDCVPINELHNVLQSIPDVICTFAQSDDPQGIGKKIVAVRVEHEA